MLKWSIIFIVLALIAGFFGFTGIAGAATGIAQLLFFGFLILLVLSFVVRAFKNVQFFYTSAAHMMGGSWKNHKVRV